MSNRRRLDLGFTLIIPGTLVTGIAITQSPRHLPWWGLAAVALMVVATVLLASVEVKE